MLTSGSETDAKFFNSTLPLLKFKIGHPIDNHPARLSQRYPRHKYFFSCHNRTGSGELALKWGTDKKGSRSSSRLTGKLILVIGALVINIGARHVSRVVRYRHPSVAVSHCVPLRNTLHRLCPVVRSYNKKRTYCRKWLWCDAVVGHATRSFVYKVRPRNVNCQQKCFWLRVCLCLMRVRIVYGHWVGSPRIQVRGCKTFIRPQTPLRKKRTRLADSTYWSKIRSALTPLSERSHWDSSIKTVTY